VGDCSPCSGMALDWPLSREEKKNRVMRLYDRDVQACDFMIHSSQTTLVALEKELNRARRQAQAFQNTAWTRGSKPRSSSVNLKVPSKRSRRISWRSSLAGRLHRQGPHRSEVLADEAPCFASMDSENEEFDGVDPSVVTDVANNLQFAITNVQAAMGSIADKASTHAGSSCPTPRLGGEVDVPLYMKLQGLSTPARGSRRPRLSKGSRTEPEEEDPSASLLTEDLDKADAIWHPFSGPRCSAGHVMVQYIAPDSRRLCDLCEKPQFCVKKGELLWGCRLCNYDLCIKCSAVRALRSGVSEYSGLGGSNLGRQADGRCTDATSPTTDSQRIDADAIMVPADQSWRVYGGRAGKGCAIYCW